MRSRTSAADGVVRAVQLPKGASAISVTYGDWIVKCQLDGGAKLCTLGQTQLSKETNQQVFVIELIARDGKAEGNILMPFGLKFDAGALRAGRQGSGAATLLDLHGTRLFAAGILSNRRDRHHGQGQDAHGCRAEHR
nr:invasion associated locus B family protein [Bradyrhizobium uaiense]